MVTRKEKDRMMKRYIKQAIVAVVFLLYLGISISISAEPIKADVMDEDYIPEENLANAELIPINVEVQKEHNIRTEKEFIYRFQITEPGLVQIELKNSAPGENLEGYVAYYYYLHLSSGIRDCTEDWIYNKDENSQLS